MYRAEERGPPPKQEDVIRRAKEAAPDRLSSKQLDPLVGKIRWPEVLRLETYAAGREQLDGLFAQRAAAGGNADVSGHVAIRNTARQMQADLKKNISEYPPSAYLEARRFLESLANEARFTSG